MLELLRTLMLIYIQSFGDHTLGILSSLIRAALEAIRDLTAPSSKLFRNVEMLVHEIYNNVK
jgi:hypothetical protein